MKLSLRSTAQTTATVLVGSALTACSLNIFLVPNKISPGGISSIGTALLYLFGIPLSVTTIVLNAFLFLFGFRLLKRSSVFKSIAGIVCLSLFLELSKFLPVYTEDPLMATLIGAVLLGLGLGILLRSGGSTGGSDLAAQLLHRFFPHISIGNLMMIVDCIIIASTALIFKSFTVAFYSLLCLYITSKVADAVMTRGDSAKAIYICTEKTKEISELLLHEEDRGLTGFYSRGMFSEKDGMVLLCVVSPKETPRVIRHIRETDPRAFIIIHDAREVLGEGFKGNRN